MVDSLLAEPETRRPAVGEVASSPKQTSLVSRLLYPAALLASLSIWLLALRAPLWLDETAAYWQVSGGFAKIWSRSALMPSSIGYLYTLWAAKSILGSQEIALKIPSTLAPLGAVYFFVSRGARAFRAGHRVSGLHLVRIGAERGVCGDGRAPLRVCLADYQCCDFCLPTVDETARDAASDRVWRSGSGDSLLSLFVRRDPAGICNLLFGGAAALDRGRCATTAASC